MMIPVALGKGLLRFSQPRTILMGSSPMFEAPTWENNGDSSGRTCIFSGVWTCHCGYGFGDLEGATKNHPQENKMWSAFGISSARLT